jgi:hypothetical protein
MDFFEPVEIQTQGTVVAYEFGNLGSIERIILFDFSH